MQALEIPAQPTEESAMPNPIDEYINRVREHVRDQIKQDSIARREMYTEIAILFAATIFCIISVSCIFIRYGM